MSAVQVVGLVFVVFGIAGLLYGYLRARERAMWAEMAADLRRREVEERARSRRRG